MIACIIVQLTKADQSTAIVNKQNEKITNYSEELQP